MSPSAGGEPSSSGSQWASVSGSFNPGSLPRITNQPPTPASQTSNPISIDTRGMGIGMGDGAPPTPAVSTSQGPPVAVWDQTLEQSQGTTGGAPGLRGRSATFNAKKAVADVVRRYHPEQPQAQAQAQV
jgi:hypothetical protein